MTKGLLSGRWREDEAYLTEAALRIAQCVASQPAQRVILLDNHLMRAVAYLLADGPRQVLEGADFAHFHSETDPAAIVTDPAKLAAYKIEQPRDERYLRESTYVMNGQGRIKYHAIGTQSESYREVWEGVDKDPALSIFKMLVVRPQLKKAPNVPKARQADQEANIFRNVLDWAIDEQKRGRAPRDTFHVCLKARVSQNFIAGLKKKGMDDGAILQRLEAEYNAIVHGLALARTFGISDSLSAKAAVDVMGPRDKAVTVYGIAHGIYGGNDAALPEQLEKQAKAKGHEAGPPSIIMLADKETAASSHRYLREAYAKGKLRAGLKVFDYELNLLLPAEEWLKKAGELYPQTRFPALPAPKP